ncbi:cell division initiation protein [Streptomyces finlayi]|uniref:Cell division initiation protein n=1 Tax=Streptomyces finlayi TaxID=67296 RepID=A0A7G7BH98_9ACTN|nr:cell division initiation protein [Streptomyces finlayi]QNE74713.1 cell division initiation protein [Streptomyces finlayi]
MDVQKKLDEIVEAVGNARSMPMSASCVVNRAELLAMLEEVREALPGSLAHAQELIGGREQLVEQARQEAERIIESAHAQRGSLVSDTEIARRSKDEADRILSEARKDAEEVRAEADEYVDSKLANFEVVLTKTIGSVDRGREKLLGRGQGYEGQGYDDPDFAEAPERSADPETLQRRADEYVDTKLGAFEAVLAKTLEAVGRGRQKLLGRVATDDLGAHMAAQDAAGSQGHTSDEDHWAGLAELSTPEPASQQPRFPGRTQPDYTSPAQPDYTSPVQPDYAPQGQPDYAPQAQPDFPVQAQPEPQYAQTYGYQDQPVQQDVYGYQQQPDPYAAYAQQGYDPNQGQPQQQEYGWSQQPAQPPAQQGESALDETSLFDTSMIDLEQLRRYEQGR